VDHGEALEFEVRQSGPHGGRHGRGGCSLELETETLVSAHDEEIELGTALCRPEEDLLRASAKPLDDLPEKEALPGRSELRMTGDRSLVRKPQERVEEPAVREVDLRRLDLPFLQVLVPWRQELNDVCSR
jgi:hypothetical protein